MDPRRRAMPWWGLVLAVAAALPIVDAVAFSGTDTFTTTYRDLEMTVTITAGTDPGRATVEVAVRIPDQGSVLIGGVRGTARDVGFLRGRPLRGRMLSMELVGPLGEAHEIVLPDTAKRPFGARTNARLARVFARRTGRLIYHLYGDFFGLDELVREARALRSLAPRRRHLGISTRAPTMRSPTRIRSITSIPSTIRPYAV